MLTEACSNVASYLLLKPDDQDMLGNKRLYLKEEGVDESFFTPRSVSQVILWFSDFVAVLTTL